MTPEPGREALAAIVAGLEGVTPGKWCQFHPSYCPEAKHASFSTWDTSHDLSAVREGTRYRIGTFKHASDAAHADRCHPEAIRSIADYVAKVEKERDEAREKAIVGEYNWTPTELQAVLDRATTAEARAEAAEERAAVLEGLIRWAHDTLWEINPSNYDHDEVCKLNDASVEVILGLAPALGETHGKSAEWWETRNALKRETQNADQ